MQNVAVIQELTVYENIDYFCGLYIPDKKTRKQYVTEAIQFVGLEDFVKFYPKKLSGGLLRRLNIACGIAQAQADYFGRTNRCSRSAEPESHSGRHPGTKPKRCDHYLHVALHGGSGADLYPYCHSGSWTKIAEGTKDELKHMIKNTETITMEVPDLPEQLHEAVQALPHVYETDYNGEQLIIRCPAERISD